MATRYRFGESQMPHFITCTVVNWIDVFSREHYKEIVIESLKYCIDSKGLTLHAWVIMSNHLHLIVSAKEGDKLADIIRDFKKYTSKQIIKAIEENQKESRREWMIWMFKRAGSKNENNKVYQFWIQDNHPVALLNEVMGKQKLDYLHQNPVRSGYVWTASEYKYSSAINYSTEQAGLLPVERL
jgi:REP element-mobilizing transposase RayT